MTIRIFTHVAIALWALAGLGSAAYAQPVTVSAAGTITSVTTAPGSSYTGGSTATLLVTFDPAAAVVSQAQSNATTRVYNLAPAFFSGGMSHAMMVNTSQPGWAQLVMQQNFIVLNGMSQSVLLQTFRFFGTGGSTVPFTSSVPATREILSFTFAFPYGTMSAPLGIADLRNPFEASAGSFSYQAGISGQPPFGAARGGAGGFLQTAAVPEPATWAMMILGFALIGAALRRKTGTVLARA